MLDQDYCRRLALGANPKRLAYDSTKYQQEDTESIDSGYHQDSRAHFAIGCDFRCAIAVGEHDKILQSGDADNRQNNMSARTADGKLGEANQPDAMTETHWSRQQICSEQPTRNTTRLEYFKGRRTHLLTKQRKLKMLQHDLYDTLVKLQVLLSEDASPPLEDKAARLTCLVAEVCAIQLQAQELHKASRHSTHSEHDPLQHKHKQKPAVQHATAEVMSDLEAAQDDHLDDSAGHGLDMACMGELIMQALQSSQRTHGSPREFSTEVIKSQNPSKGDVSSRAQMSKVTADSQPSRLHGRATRLSQVSPAEVQASWQGREEQSRDIPAGSRDHDISGAVSKMDKAGAAGPAGQPEATLGRWHRRDEEAGDHDGHNCFSQPSTGTHTADKLHVDTQAHDGRYDRLLTMLQAELVLHGAHTGSQNPTQLHQLCTPVKARTGALSGHAETRLPTARPAQVGFWNSSQQSGEAALSSRFPLQAVQESGYLPQQPAHGRFSVKEPRQADWDSSILAVVDPDKVMKTRSGLRLHPPTQPAMAATAARPMSAYSLRNRPTTGATVAGSERPASRLGVGPRSQWDQGSRGSRRPDWDDRFIVPEHQRQGQRQVEGIARVHAFRASTPDRVLKENLPKRKQQHPWLSKRALQLRGQQPQPRSRRAASAPRPGPEGFESLPSTSAHSGTDAGPLAFHEMPDADPGSGHQLRSAVNARSKGPATEMPDSDICPNGAPVSVLAQLAVPQQHPGLGLYDEAASHFHMGHIVDGHHGAASELKQQDEQGGSLCERHLKERLDDNMRNTGVQKPPSQSQSCAANSASVRLAAGSILGGAVSAEPLLAQLEDMEARMKAMMSTIESRLYGKHSIQGIQ